MLTLSNDFWAATILPAQGGGLTRLDWLAAGTPFPVLRPAPDEVTLDPNQLACFPLVPWSNRLWGHALPMEGGSIAVPQNWCAEPYPIHGDAWRSAWQLVEATEHQIVLKHDARPWLALPYQALMSYTLTGDQFHCQLTALNTGQKRAPFGLGLHPFFKRTPGTRIRAQTRHVWPPITSHSSCRCIPTDSCNFPANGQWQPLPEQTLDHCAGGWDGRAHIHWPEIRKTLSVDTWPPARFMVLYAPSGADFFCLEPVTHANDAHRKQPEGGDLGLVWLAPGQHLSLEMTFQMQDDHF